MQLHIRNFQRSLDIIRLHNWKLSSDSLEKQAVMVKLPEKSHHSPGSHQLAFTKGIGPPSSVDAVKEVYLQARPLLR